jgi:RNA polymerase sigma-70 factor (ECF subfamily)
MNGARVVESAIETSPLDDVEVTSLHVERPAWQRLYDELGERVYRLILRMTRDEELARDLTHDTFVRVFETRAQYQGRGTVRAWVFQIAVNLLRERARTTRRRGELLEREGMSGRTVVPDEAGRVESRIVLDEALASLPADQRAALLLYEVDGYTHAEIGEMFGVAEGSSKARVSRAKATLRERLKGRI